MKTKQTLRKHEVRALISNVELVKAKSALALTIYANKQKLGEIQVGRGSLYWWGAKRQTGKRIDWSRFAEMLDQLAYGSQK